MPAAKTLQSKVQEDIESDKNPSDQLRHPISFAPYLARKRIFEKVRPNISVSSCTPRRFASTQECMFLLVFVNTFNKGNEKN